MAENEECCDDVSENEQLSSAAESPVDTESSVESEMKTSSSLQLMLASIAEERNKEPMPGGRMVSDEGEFVMVNKNTFWTALFEKHFLDAPDDYNRDDMLFYVKKTCTKSKFNIPQTEIQVFRKGSHNQPSLLDPAIDWEETVYLNIILQHFEYQVTCAVCTRTGDKELQILKKYTEKVYASPSRRRMDSKGTEEELTYPNIFFTVDNFEEVFGDIVVRDSEMVCVELVVKDRTGTFQGVVFLGSIRYEALKRVYDARASLSHRMAQRMAMGWFKNHKRVEFVRMRGPQGKGYAEMAVSRVKGTGPETPDQTPNTENFPLDDFEQQENPYTKRRMSDPSNTWNTFLRGSFKRSSMRKSQSETENVDTVGPHGCTEVEAENIRDEFDDAAEHYDGFWGRSFGQAFHWFKERRRANSIALHSYLTYITLPWHRIIADIVEVRQEPVLSFS